MKRVIGIGNALTDMLVNLNNDEVLERYNISRGSMSLVSSDLQAEVTKAVAHRPHSLSLGGSAGNTIRAMAHLGCDVGYIGKVGRDDTGDFFVQALQNLGIEPFVFRSQSSSGKCLSLISADGERTMLTHLGAALELCAEEVTASVFDGYDCLYVEGYLVQDHTLIESVIRIAKGCGLKVAIDLASYNVVAENIDFLRRIVTEYVDIVFANEDEAKAFSGADDPSSALAYISERCALTVVKVGTKGALIQLQGQQPLQVGILRAAKRVDTTGAGDFYAAGFMYGMTEGLDLRQCGTIGAITAGKVIEVVGTTLADEVWEEINRYITRVKTEKYLF